MNSQTNRISRDSNMELYRIVCMMLVVLFHVCGVIDITNDNLSPDDRSIGVLPTQLITSATFVCVDVFVLLSGWYGIKAKLSKIIAFIYQVLFYSIISYILFILFCPDLTFSLNMLFYIFFFENYWFIPAYMILFVISPILNKFIDNSSHHEFKYVLIAAFLLQCIYGWLIPKEHGFLEGCSPFSFMLLYLLAAYARKYPIRLKNLSKKSLFILYFLAISINALVAYFGKIKSNQAVIDTVYQFSSPIIIFASLCLLLIFSKIKLRHNTFINWVAASSFAVFLIHCFPLFIRKIFWPIVEYYYINYSLFTFIGFSVIFALLLYISSILIDQIRIFTYNLIKKVI